MKILIRTTLIAALLLTATSWANAAKRLPVRNTIATTTTVSGPDFAYPAEVTKQAEKQLEEALKSRDGEKTVRALTNIALAQSAIGNEKLPPVVRQIETIKSQEKNGVTRSLLALLLADIYYEIYTANKYNYDRRELPLTPRATDYNEWSGSQFRACIEDLCNEALEASESLQKEPLSAYSDIITASKETLVYYPTLYDFAAQFTIDTRKRLTPFSSVFTLLYLTPAKAFVATPIVVTSAPAATLLATYAEWEKFHIDDTAPLINIDLQRIAFVRNNVFNRQLAEAAKKQETLLWNLYDKYSESEYSGDILLAIANNIGDDNDSKKKIYAALTSNISRYPAYHRIGCLKNVLANLSAESCNISMPEVTAPGFAAPIKVSIQNMSSATFDIYKLNDTNQTDNYYRFKDGNHKLVKSITVNIPGTVPFKTDTTVTTTFQEPGCYFIEVRGNQNRRNSYNIIRCSQLALAAAQLNGNATLIAIDPVSGKAVSEADIMSYDRIRRELKATLSGKTDRNGFFQKTLKDGSQCFGATKNGDKFSRTVTLYYHKTNPGTDTTIEAFTDLSLYHPGDTIRWVAVVYSTNKASHKAIGNSAVKATLYSPNREKLNSTTATTDEFGRATGYFIAPENTLTGHASIEFGSGNYGGYANIMISDYKLPTFAPEFTAIDMNTPSRGDIRLRGKAQTYAGAAVGNATVTLNLSVAPKSFWSRFNYVDFYSAESTTDADGNWTFELPAKVFEASPEQNGIFRANATVTSQSGESRQTMRTFTLEPTYLVAASLPSSIEISNPVGLNVRVEDGEGKTVVKNIRYVIENTQKENVDSGLFVSSKPTVDLCRLAGGKYIFTFSIEGEQEQTTAETILYRQTDKYSPVGQPLWTPQDNTTLNLSSRRKAKILYATASDNSNVLYILSSSLTGKIHEMRWLNVGQGFHELSTEMPRDTKDAMVRLMCVKNMEQSTATVNLSIKDPEDELTILTEAFRDRITPQAKEVWRFRTVNGDSTGCRAAMMIDMYNAALDDIVNPSRFNRALNPQPINMPSLNLDEPSLHGLVYGNYYTRSNLNQSCQELMQPEWQLYGRTFANIRIRGYSRAYKSALMSATVGAVNKAAVTEAEESISEDMVRDEAKMESADAGNTPMSNTSNTPQPFEYRRSELPFGLYEPMLTTDANGNLEYTFTAPNANATWNFNAIAFTSQLATASINRKIKSSKPVMVQPNLPRFLRCGDKAIVKSTVMNQSEESLEIMTHTELFDVATGDVVSQSDTVTTVMPGTSAVVSHTITAPYDAPFIGYRIKSSANGYADGEQSYITVLPFTTPVIETKPFYLEADSSELTMKLPEMPSDARVTLQFCSNPVWYVVTALPGLCNNDPATSVEAASSIFNTAIADGLLKQYPEIKTTLDEWTRSDRSDSTLVSMLERNADLKTVLLNATPWMMDAKSDTERMARLALLFDKKLISASYAKAIDLLEKLQREDGGWAWRANNEKSSLWATESVLNFLGMLNEAGYMPDNQRLADMASKALSMTERETLKMWRKYPKHDYSSFVTLLDKWPSFRPSADSKRLTAAVVQKTVGNWKSYSIASKAEAAMLLSRHGYVSTARQVLKSLRQFAVVSPTEGMYWPSVGDEMGGTMSQLLVSASALQAFTALEKGSSDIDAIRQWLILQKETRNWGNSASASAVVTAILRSNADLTTKANDFTLKIGDREITTTDIDRHLGYIRKDISMLRPSGKTLTVEMESARPAWGAIFCQFTEVMTEVKPEKCEAISIEKKLLKKEGGQWTEAKNLTIGDRVKVMLTIKSSRDLQYVAITDDRAACLEPVEQMPTPLYSDGLCFYRENLDSRTTMYVDNMPKGTYILSYEMWVNNEGDFSSGIATIQSQYAPQISAHSGGNLYTVR